MNGRLDYAMERLRTAFSRRVPRTRYMDDFDLFPSLRHPQDDSDDVLGAMPLDTSGYASGVIRPDPEPDYPPQYAKYGRSGKSSSGDYRNTQTVRDLVARVQALRELVPSDMPQEELNSAMEQHGRGISWGPFVDRAMGRAGPNVDPYESPADLGDAVTAQSGLNDRDTPTQSARYAETPGTIGDYPEFQNDLQYADEGMGGMDYGPSPYPFVPKPKIRMPQFIPRKTPGPLVSARYADYTDVVNWKEGMEPPKASPERADALGIRNRPVPSDTYYPPLNKGVGDLPFTSPVKPMGGESAPASYPAGLSSASGVVPNPLSGPASSPSSPDGSFLWGGSPEPMPPLAPEGSSSPSDPNEAENLRKMEDARARGWNPAYPPKPGFPAIPPFVASPPQEPSIHTISQEAWQKMPPVVQQALLKRWQNQGMNARIRGFSVIPQKNPPTPASRYSILGHGDAGDRRGPATTSYADRYVAPWGGDGRMGNPQAAQYGSWNRRRSSNGDILPTRSQINPLASDPNNPPPWSGWDDDEGDAIDPAVEADLADLLAELPPDHPDMKFPGVAPRRRFYSRASQYASQTKRSNGDFLPAVVLARRQAEEDAFAVTAAELDAIGGHPPGTTLRNTNRHIEENWPMGTSLVDDRDNQHIRELRMSGEEPVGYAIRTKRSNGDRLPPEIVADETENHLGITEAFRDEDMMRGVPPGTSMRQWERERATHPFGTDPGDPGMVFLSDPSLNMSLSMIENPMGGDLPTPAPPPPGWATGDGPDEYACYDDGMGMDYAGGCSDMLQRLRAMNNKEQPPTPYDTDFGASGDYGTGGGMREGTTNDSYRNDTSEDVNSGWVDRDYWRENRHSA